MRNISKKLRSISAPLEQFKQEIHTTEFKLIRNAFRLNRNLYHDLTKWYDKLHDLQILLKHGKNR